jgi:hypothetical protein
MLQSKSERHLAFRFGFLRFVTPSVTPGYVIFLRLRLKSLILLVSPDGFEPSTL